MDDPHPEGLRPTRHCCPDASHADDAEGGAVELHAAQQCRTPSLPATRCDESMPLNNPPRSGEQQGHGEVGGGRCEHARSVGHTDTERLRRIEIDVVHTDI